MFTAVLLGAGQMGEALSGLINRNRCKILAFGDNDPKKWGKDGETDILSVEEAIALDPDIVFVSLTGAGRTELLKEQARRAGYRREILSLDQIRETFDVRAGTVRFLAARIREQEIPGDAAELGVYQGDLAWQINLFLPDRKLYLFDTFEGFAGRDIRSEKQCHDLKRLEGKFSDTDPDAVLARMPYRENVILKKGFFPDTAVGLEEARYSLVSLDPDLYAPVLAGLKYFYPRLNPGGAIVLHDYNNRQFPGVRRAVREYEQCCGRLNIVPLPDLHGSCVIIK